MTEFILNNQSIQTDLHPATTILDFIRYERGSEGNENRLP